LAADILSNDKNDKEKYHITEIIIDQGLLKAGERTSEITFSDDFCTTEHYKHTKLQVSHIVI